MYGGRNELFQSPDPTYVNVSDILVENDKKIYTIIAFRTYV